MRKRFSRKTLMIPAIALTMIAGAMMTSHAVFAQSDSSKDNTLVKRLAERFNLNETEVTAFFEELRDERQAEHHARLAEKLSQYVTDGKLTEAKKNAILEKFMEMQDKHEAMHEQMKTMTPEQRREAMKQEKDELKDWAEQQGIDMKYLFFGGMGKFDKGDKGRQGVFFGKRMAE